MIRWRMLPVRGTSRRAAAPDGGATLWVWGCALALALALTSPLAADEIPVPSGQPVTLSEVLVDEVGAETWLRFRFLAPQIARDGGTISYGQAAADMEQLCAAFALPYIAEWDLSGALIVISLSDRAVPFGQADPDATQFFDAFTVQDGTCMWEEF